MTESYRAPETNCTSCGVVLLGEGTSTFMCPNCGEKPIGRCRRCRDQGVPYLCTQCGFQGP